MGHEHKLVPPARELERRGEVDRVERMDRPSLTEGAGNIDERPTDPDEQDPVQELAGASAGIREDLGQIARLTFAARESGPRFDDEKLRRGDHARFADDPYDL